MTVGVASSIMPDFDTQRTVDFATENNCTAVQPFINEQLRDQKYLDGLIERLKSNPNLDVILHLPNMDKLEKADVEAAAQIENALLPRRVRTLVHYEEGMTVAQVPVVAGEKVGIENSLTGMHSHEAHKRHVLDALILARETGSFFVFDPGRMMYRDSEMHDVQPIRDFILQIIKALDPAIDVIHMADKGSWDMRFREWPLAFPEGISDFMVRALQDFHEQGGVIIFEHEDAEMALASVKYFES